MKKFGKFLRNPPGRGKRRKARAVRKRNPVPFALTAINPAKKSKRKRRKNPAVSGTIARKVGKQKWHHKKGRFLYNPAKRKKRRRKNPLAVKHVIVETPAKNPVRRRRNPGSVDWKKVTPNQVIDRGGSWTTKDGRVITWGSLDAREAHDFLRWATRNQKKLSSVKPNPPMSKKRKRRSRSTRNPVVSHKRRRRSSRRRNPARRSRYRRMRNPIAILNDVTAKENLMVGGGALVGIVGTRWLVNTLIQGDPVTGQRMFDLPGITYSTATAPLSQAQFTAKNKLALAFYEIAIPVLLGYAMRNQNAQFSKGLLASAVVNAGIAAIRSTQMGARAGLGAFLPRARGMGTYIPGVPPMLSGPATGFINSGSPVPRRGMGAVVNQRWAAQTVSGSADPFKKN